MPISPARLAAFEILLRVEQQDAYASELLHSERLTGLSHADRGLCMEIVMGVLRWRSWLDERIAEHSFTPFRKLDPQVLTALRIGAYQLLFLERIPASAAVNESVELVKKSKKASAAGLANVVLRKIKSASPIPPHPHLPTAGRYGAPSDTAPGSNESSFAKNSDYDAERGEVEESAVQSRAGEKADSSPRNDKPLASPNLSLVQEASQIEQSNLASAGLSHRFAHPLWIVERWIREYGSEFAAAICRFNQTVPATSLRLLDPTVESELKAEGVELAPGELLIAARHVVHGDIIHTRAYAEGRTFIQDEASQLVALLVGSAPPCSAQDQGSDANARDDEADRPRRTRILDCCAAPGGKTAAIASRNPDAEIIAVDLHEHRLRLMRKLVSAPNVRTIAADITNTDSLSGEARVWMDGQFDCVLADVPCSGTGTLARNPEIKWKLKPEDIVELHARQVAILRAAIAKLAPGGRLVYSTCSLEREENEEVIEEVLRAHNDLSLRDCAGELQQMKTELAIDPSSLTRGNFLRTIPGVQRCDGFFAAIIEKASD